MTSQLVSTNRRLRINQYQRGQRVGKGKHGEVYLCHDDNIRQEVAVKVVRRSNPRDKIKLLRKSHQQQAWPPPLSSTEQSIRKEIAIMKRCRHPHHVRLLEVIDDPHQEKIYLAMEYLSGGPVQWTNKEQQPILTVFQTRRIIRDVISGLEYLHHQGIIHRDIKPANLLWTEDRSVIKIIDFGVSHLDPKLDRRKRQEKDLPEVLALFPESDLLKRTGTPSFLAPEVVWVPDYATDFTPTTSSDTLTPGALPHNVPTTDKSRIPTTRPPITPAIDLWSLGVTFYCLLFGRTPFNVPESAHDNIHHSEYMLYHQICIQDWEADETMGADKLTTGGRHPPDRNSEGYVIISLLNGLLHKDPRDRMKLAEFKCHPWTLQDIADPDKWLRNTAFEPPETQRSRWTRTVKQVFRGLIPCSK
ncbi:kinase-like protein [Pluteus cervinus]|uniref:Kinase-like protein n=1 Tax=Pluteus cervinus TaxID=181527 RepID=A0ACD3B7L6_9AGAR|nr:kinase-like protein [Pluteus cervinus]